DWNPASGDWAIPRKAATALGRYGRVDEVAAVVAFVAGPESSYITGANLTVDGGMNTEPTVSRLTANPFRGIPKANEKADPRRQRRAMTEDELRRLLDVTRERPLLDALTVRRGPRQGQPYANVRVDRPQWLRPP